MLLKWTDLLWIARSPVNEVELSVGRTTTAAMFTARYQSTYTVQQQIHEDKKAKLAGLKDPSILRSHLTGLFLKVLGHTIYICCEKTDLSTTGQAVVPT